MREIFGGSLVFCSAFVSLWRVLLLCLREYIYIIHAAESMGGTTIALHDFRLHVTMDGPAECTMSSPPQAKSENYFQ